MHTHTHTHTHTPSTTTHHPETRSAVLPPMDCLLRRGHRALCVCVCDVSERVSE